jgi:hypothetical protein
MGLVIISDTTMFMFRRLMRDEEELRGLERSLLVSRIHEKSAYNLWLTLEEADLGPEAKVAHTAYTDHQRTTLNLERLVAVARGRLLANVTA